MKEDTEELLYQLLWVCDMLCRPSYRHVFETFESWTYRRGLRRRLSYLEMKQLIERKELEEDRVYRLTQAGILHALGGCDPEARWERPWDGRWHLVLFDVPNAQTRLRNQLRSRLRQARLGWLQRSVWVSPDAIHLDRSIFQGTNVDVESLVFLEASPAAGESNEDIVAGAWDFGRINQLYQEHLLLLSSQPEVGEGNAIKAAHLRDWGRQERESWNRLVSLDPFLPNCLLPKGYQGRVVWEQRKAALRRFGAHLRRSDSWA